MESISLTLCLVVSFTAITSMIIGYDLCIVTSVQNVIMQDFNLCTHSMMNCFRKAFFVSMLPPGAMVGSFIAGFYSGWFGRKAALMLGDIFITIGSICFAFGPTYNLVLLGRFIIGIGIGVGFVVFSIYIPEISPPKYRGALVAAQDCTLSIGCLLSYVIMAFTSAKNWRVLLGGVGVVSFVQFLGAFLLPESPRWLIRRDKHEAAIQAITKLSTRKQREHYLKTNFDGPKVQVNKMAEEYRKEQNLREAHHPALNLEQIADDQELADESATVTPKTPIRKKMTSLQQLKYSWALISKYRREVLIAVGCAVAQNFTMSNSIIYFSLDFLNQAGVHNDILAGVGIGLMKFLGVLSAIILVDVVGRKFLLFWGSVVTCICLFSFAIVSALRAYTSFDAPALSVVIIMIHIYAWNISWAGLMFVVASEILVSSVRAMGMGLTITMFWFLSFLFQTIIEPAVDTFKPQFVFAFFGFLNIFSILFVVRYIKDYTGVALEDVSVH